MLYLMKMTSEADDVVTFKLDTSAQDFILLCGGHEAEKKIIWEFIFALKGTKSELLRILLESKLDFLQGCQKELSLKKDCITPGLIPPKSCVYNTI